MAFSSINTAFVVSNQGITLSATLSSPPGARHFPVVVAVHASGFGERGFYVYQHLLESLLPHKIGVCLFDRRGSGASGGDFDSATFDDLASDVLAVVDHLQSLTDPAIGPIGLWGMSQGGWIAPLAATRSTRVAFQVLVSSTSCSPGEQMDFSAATTLREQGFVPADINQAMRLRGLVNAYHLGAASHDALSQELRAREDAAWFGAADLPLASELPRQVENTKWRCELLHNPRPVLAGTRIPTLLLFGERDPWIPIDETITAWHEALGTRAADLLTTRRIPDANHFMAAISEVGHRGIHGRIVQAYADALQSWIRHSLGNIKVA